jgi:hypothetical protein
LSIQKSPFDNRDSKNIKKWKTANSSTHAWQSTRRDALENYGTIFNACTTAGAAVFDDSAGAFSDFDFEIARGPLDAFYVCVSDQFDVQVPADLDQFG